MKVQPDRNEVYPNLFVGSAPFAMPDGFDLLVLAAVEHQPRFHCRPDQGILYVPLDDHPPTQKEKLMALKAALLVHSYLERGKRVLVTCHAGLNRSSWIAALAMRMMGMKAPVTLARIRHARGPLALNNKAFVQTVEAVR